MNNLTPSQDQLAGQLRLLITSLGAIATTLGVSGTTANFWVNLALSLTGPAIILGGIALTLIANSRKSIMTAAAKPAAPGLAPPQIVLPAQEKALADALPANVTAALPH
jgi:hypothetical protein